MLSEIELDGQHIIFTYKLIYASVPWGLETMAAIL